VTSATQVTASSSTTAFARREQLQTFENAWQRGQRPTIEEYLPQGMREPELRATCTSMHRRRAGRFLNSCFVQPAWDKNSCAPGI